MTRSNQYFSPVDREKGVIFNSNNKLYIAYVSYAEKENRLHIAYCSNPDDAWIIERRGFNISVYCRHKKFEFRAHSPVDVVTKIEEIYYGTK